MAGADAGLGGEGVLMLSVLILSVLMLRVLMLRVLMPNSVV